MSLNPYDSCPCGSGKKFKFCCEKYFDRIEKAYRLREGNQHDAALRAFEQITRDYPNVPQVWGYFAQFLYAENLSERAEQALARAFELNPNFGMGFLIRAQRLLDEGELIGALLMFRKAEAAIDPSATVTLYEVYSHIAQIEMLLYHPIACRMAFDRLFQLGYREQAMRQQFEDFFGESSKLPPLAKQAYSFRPTVKPTVADAFRERLTDLKDRFQKLCELVPADPAAWFNLGLVHAWLGEQEDAIQALEQSLQREWDDRKAEETAALMEVLHFGAGMEQKSDYLIYRRHLGIRDPQPVLNLVDHWYREKRLFGLHVNEARRMIRGYIIAEIPSLIDTGNRLARIQGQMLLTDNVLTLSSETEATVAALADEVRATLNLAVTEPESSITTSTIHDIVMSYATLPLQIHDQADWLKKRRELAQNYFEEIWAKQPLKSLGGLSPQQAASSPQFRKRLLGIIKFHQECYQQLIPKEAQTGSLTAAEEYHFDQLRKKLGAELQPAGEAPKIEVPVEAALPDHPGPSGETLRAPTTASGVPGTTQAGSGTPWAKDFSTLTAAELAELPLDTLSLLELEQAMRVAVKLDARELAARFAAAGVAKPADPAKPDRYTFYVCLVTKAVSDGDLEAALKYIEAGAADDAKHNAGKRANDFSLHKAKLYAKRGDIAAASREFDALLSRQPTEGKFYISAAEAMLSARNSEQALRYAQAGLTQARASNNRDLEGACLELSEAASRQSR